jgi:hypothetical protein
VRGSVLVLLLCAAGLGAPCSTFARVFSRSGSLRPVTPGSAAYRATIRVNQGEAAVAVVQPDRPVAAPAEWLRAQCESFGALAALSSGAGFTRAAATSPTHTLRLLALADPRAEPLLVEVLQSNAERARSAAAPALSLPDGVAPYPGATPRTSLHNDDTRTTVLALTAPAEPDAVLAHYRAALAAAGWTATLPAPASGRSGDLLLYVRGQALCCVLARRQAGQCSVTVLHKAAALP